MQTRPDLHLNHFNGPLALLLDLIRKNRVKIYDIPIVEVTNQYLADLKHLKILNLDVWGDFLVMASKLMLIKSRMLLPRTRNHYSSLDPRSGLVRQLMVYKRYRSATRQLKKLAQKRRAMYTRPAVVPSRNNGLLNLHRQLNVKILQKVFKNVIRRKMNQAPVSHQITEWNYSVRSQASRLLELLRNHRALRLNQIFGIRLDLERLVTDFLALLDLVKEHRIFLKDHRNVVWLQLVNKRE